jgi:uncharacterized repeat protein (TIGR02543 family)
MTAKTLRKVMTIVLAAAALAACPNPILFTAAPATPGGAGHSLALSWHTGTGGRTILPASYPVPATYDVFLHPASGSDLSQADVSDTRWTFTDLAATVYAIKVLGRDGRGNVIVAGTGSADMTGAASQVASVTLGYIVSGPGNGQLHLTFDASSAGVTVTTTSLTLVDSSGAKVVNAAALTGSSPTFTYSNTSLPTGSYTMFAKLSSGSQVALKLDTIVIVQNVDTAATVTVGSPDFNSAYVAVSSLSLDRGSISLTAGSFASPLSATLSPATASNTLVSWSSSNAGVASVDQNGVVTPVAAGTATITAASADNPSASAQCSVTVTAPVVTYEVTFDCTNVTVPPNPATILVSSPATTVGSLPADPQRNGYSFTGWYTAGGAQFTASAPVTQDITVYAHWSLVSYTITYVLNDGSSPGTSTSTYTTDTGKATLLVPTRTGYNFVGWYSDASLQTQLTTVPAGTYGNVSLYAAWSASGQVMPPTFNPPSGTYSSSQAVTISSGTTGATIYYTTDGTDPTVSATRVQGSSVTVSAADTVILAYSTKSGLTDSDIVRAEYQVLTSVATPTASLTTGTYSSSPTVILACSTPGSSIHYTTDGSTPTGGSALYTGPIEMSGSTTIKAVGTAGALVSAVCTYLYTVDPTSVSTPQVTPAGGSYTSAQAVTLSDWTSGATIYYTTNGADPATSGTVYSAPISIGTPLTLKVVAKKAGMASSTTVSATYSFPTPTIGFSITAVGLTKKVMVTWSPVSGAASYNLYWVQGQVNPVTPTTSKVVKVSNVSSGFLLTTSGNNWYSFMVEAVNQFGASASASATSQAR